jgi:hypothetical protein
LSLIRVGRNRASFVREGVTLWAKKSRFKPWIKDKNVFTQDNTEKNCLYFLKSYFKSDIMDSLNLVVKHKTWVQTSVPPKDKKFSSTKFTVRRYLFPKFPN